MTVQPLKHFNLPWHQNDHYWISLYPKEQAFPAALGAALQEIGLQMQQDGSLAIQTLRQWKPVWDLIYTVLGDAQALNAVDAEVTPGALRPPERAMPDGKRNPSPQALAESLWVGTALLEDRIMCYLQPVIDSSDKVFGYESFARVQTVEGKIIGGAQIVVASKVLGIEHMIDRHLHIQAIKTFASSDFNGFLFVNFFPGFIHRPSVYLEGLSETAKSFGVISKHIVLDFTKSETPRDIMHIRSVSDYGRSCGYSIALDDITSVEAARKLIPDIRPDFVKLDMQLVREVKDPYSRDTIRTIVDMVHTVHGTVIAEGVETAEIHQALKLLGVDLFQGYLFSAPVPVEAAIKQSGAA